MSKQGKRKITVDPSKSKDFSNRPSVFERLGAKKTVATTDYCRQWAQSGNCAYGKNCKFAASHTLVSPSKQRAIKEGGHKQLEQEVYVIRSRKDLQSTVLVKSGNSPSGDIDKWDQNDLEFADTDVLEKRRQELQRELELQMKMDSGKNSRTKEKKKAITSSSSSRSSSSSSVSSSTSNDSTYSSSGRDAKKKNKKGKTKRNSSSSPDRVSKKKFVKSNSKHRKNDYKRGEINSSKKGDSNKKKLLQKTIISKKPLSPGKKSTGTPPLISKNSTRTVRQSKSPLKKEKAKSRSPSFSKDRVRNKMKEKNYPRGRSRSKRSRSRSPHLNLREARKKGSPDKSRASSPRRVSRIDGSHDKYKRRSLSKDKIRDNKERSIERKKNDDKKDRGRDRSRDLKRDDSKRRGRGLSSRGTDKGLEKPNKPMERLLPRPEERLAALAAITNKLNETDKGSAKDKQDRGIRKDKIDRDRVGKRERLSSIDRERSNRDSLDRAYDSHRVEHYDRKDKTCYSNVSRDPSRSPTYSLANRDRHYEGYDLPGPSRAYQDDERLYEDHTGFDDQRGRTWDGHSGSANREHSFETRKNWDNDDYRNTGDWARDRHWSIHDPQMDEWGSKESGIGRWHHRGHPPGHRGKMHDDYAHARMDNGSNSKRHSNPNNSELPTETARKEQEIDEKPIPDDLSEISDDPDDILNRDDIVDQNYDNDSQTARTSEAVNIKFSEKESTQDTSAAGEKDSHYIKDEDDLTNMDFEEISDGELEEEKARAGIGDALGVDWASLVADVRRREQPPSVGGARDRWRPNKVLSRIGLSFNLAGKQTVYTILKASNQEAEASQENGEENKHKESNANDDKQDCTQTILDNMHPVAAIQVAQQKRKHLRAALFGTGCDVTRALSARRDLALRRHLCNLPVMERSGQPCLNQSPNLFEAARALLTQAPLAV